MEPQVQYAKTSDGVSIAYWTIGKGGTPLVQMPAGYLSHIEREWQVPPMRQWFERLARKRMVVRYDGRGTGLSDRDVSEYSLETVLMDLEAVADCLGLEVFSLLGCFSFGAAAIAYAARHPRRVSRLGLWCAQACPADSPPAARKLREIGDMDWGLFSDLGAGLSVTSPDETRAVSTLIRESVMPEAARAMDEAWQDMDVTSLLGEVAAPTLVLHRRDYPFIPIDAAKRLAAGISRARLAVLEGSSGFAVVEHVESVMEAVEGFLSEGDEPEAQVDTDEPDAFRTILFTDMEGSTALTQELGDAKAQEILRAHNNIVREALAAHGGTETKHTGDGIMASFTSVTAALAAAVAIQKALADHNEGNPDSAIHVRIGLNAGEPVAEDEDLFGTAVQLAARVCDRAEPGQILASNVVQELAAGKGFTFVDKGEATLKGFDKPVRLHEVRWRDD